VLKEAALHFVMAYERRDFERTVDLLACGALLPGAMITGRIGLDDVPHAFDALASPSDQGKLLVMPWAAA
jgi:threonine dehydrogenase-like Zn-dependent dehydrogenase